MKCPRNTSRRRAFSLLELLTVMAILSVLVAVMMPALSGGKQRGRITKCQAQIRELARAMQTYTSQNGDSFPVVRDCVSNTCAFWNGHQYYGWTGTQLNPNQREWNRVVNKELSLDPAPSNPDAAKVARCPDDDGAPGETGSYDPLFTVLGNSYPVNPILVQGEYAEWKYRDRSLSTSQVLDTSKKILLGEHPYFGLTYDGYWTAIRPGWHDKISPAAGVAFIDGHAEYVKSRGALKESQWYADAPGPDWIDALTTKVDWTVWPEAK